MLDHSMLVMPLQAADPKIRLLGGFLAPGALAVQYFFVLSGFVMMTAHRGDFGRWSAPLKFWWRRACRIYPMYWLAVAIIVACSLRHIPDLNPFRLLSLAPYPSPELIPSAWTLRYEVCFYVMFGLGLLPGIGPVVLAGWIFCTAWVWCPAVASVMQASAPQLLVQLAQRDNLYFLSYFGFYFFAGVLGGWMFAATNLGRRGNQALCAAGILVLALSLPAISWGTGYGNPPIQAVTGLALAAIIVGLGGLERNGVLRLGKKARWLGAASYPIYILHRALMTAAGLNDPHFKLHAFGLYVLLFGFMAVKLAICFAIAFWIDRPLQRRLRRVRLRFQPQPVSAR